MNREQKLAFISSVITSELFRPIMIKTMLSAPQVSRMIGDMSLEVLDSIGPKEFIEQAAYEFSVQEAKVILFKKHSLKL